jgi:mannose-6-phosphate isomerase-like protein (cupin superfamily)
MPPLVIDHATQERASWRPGNLTQLKVGAQNGSERVAMAEQWFEPGTGAPTHTHHDVEEVITILAGRAEFWCDDERAIVEAEQSIVLPPFSWHGFTNIGDGELHLLGVWSVASVPTDYQEAPDRTYAIGGAEGERADAARTVQSS